MHASKLSPSMMCADVLELPEVLSLFKKNDVEYLHIDIMDGEFVQNYTLGTDFCDILRKACSIPLDIHLMISKPERKIGWFSPRPGEYVSVHVESTQQISRALAEIRNRQAKPMVALNPGTPVETIRYLLDDIDGVLIMAVNPGFAGQRMIPAAVQKIRDTRRFLDEKGYSNIEIEVDGNVSFENAKIMRNAGANIFVGGTSSVFSKKDPIGDNIVKMRNVIL